MKKFSIYKFIAPAVLIILTSSCQKELDLTPAQSISNEAALGDDESVKQALNGAYDIFSYSGLFGGEVMRNSELYGGDGELNWNGTFTAPREIFQRNILATNVDVDDLWTDAYECINACNSVLNALDVVDDADKNRVEGEAKCLRAWCYFELTKYFGQQYEVGETNSQLAVPIVLTPTTGFDESNLVSRNTVDECYAQVINDLSAAVSLLPESNGVYIDKQTAQAILARVYLQMGDYNSALNEADAVINTGIYHLVTGYANCFGQDENTSEDIFAIQVSDQDGTNSMNTYFATNTYGGRGDIQILDEHINLYSAGDTRKDLFYLQAGTYFTGKFNNETGNVTVIRLAEMYITRAECNLRLGTEIGNTPANDYNATHTRAGLPVVGSVTLDDILLERHLELAFEGQRFWDIKRLHQSVAGMPYNDDKMIFPIPQSERDVNPNLVQNPSY